MTRTCRAQHHSGALAPPQQKNQSGCQTKTHTIEHNIHLISRHTGTEAKGPTANATQRVSLEPARNASRNKSFAALKNCDSNSRIRLRTTPSLASRRSPIASAKPSIVGNGCADADKRTFKLDGKSTDPERRVPFDVCKKPTLLCTPRPVAWVFN